MLCLRGRYCGLCMYAVWSASARRTSWSSARSSCSIIGVEADVGDVAHAVTAAPFNIFPVGVALTLDVVGFCAPHAKALPRVGDGHPAPGQGASPVVLLTSLRCTGALLGAVAGGLSIHVDLHDALHLRHGMILYAPPLCEHALVLDAGQHVEHHVLVEHHEVGVAQLGLGF